jgi:hypothetical protein
VVSRRDGDLESTMRKAFSDIMVGWSGSQADEARWGGNFVSQDGAAISSVKQQYIARQHMLEYLI